MKYVQLLSASHSTKELLTASAQPYLKVENAAEGVKILHEVGIEISSTNWHTTDADPMQKTLPTRNWAFNKSPDTTCWCLKTQSSVMQQYNLDSAKSRM